MRSTPDHNEGVSNAVERINTFTKIQQDISSKPNPSCPLNVRATEVLPGVYLGNASDAADHAFLTGNKIRYILNLTSQCPNYFEGKPQFHYKQIKIEDSCREDIKNIIADAIDFIGEWSVLKFMMRLHRGILDDKKLKVKFHCELPFVDFLFQEIKTKNHFTFCY